MREGVGCLRDGEREAFQGVADMLLASSPRYAKKQLEHKMIMLLFAISLQQLLIFTHIPQKANQNKGKYAPRLEK